MNGDLMKPYDRGKYYLVPKEIVQLYGLLPDFKTDAMILYTVLRDKRNIEGVAWPSRYQLEMETGIPNSTIGKRLTVLQKYGLIEREPRDDGDGIVFRVYDPLPESDFIQRFPEVLGLRADRAAKVEARKARDRANKRRGRRERKNVPLP